MKVSERHRALGDAQLIHQFWQDIHKTFDAALIAATVKKLVGRPSTPSQIDDNLIQGLPDTPGVYLFYGENDLPLYVGKSTHIKQRVLSHFSADHRHSKEMSLSQQLRRIEYIEKRALSAHADQSQLLTWANHFKNPKPRLYLIHGEKTACLSLQTCFNRMDWHASIPKVGEQISF